MGQGLGRPYGTELSLDRFTQFLRKLFNLTKKNRIFPFNFYRVKDYNQ